MEKALLVKDLEEFINNHTVHYAACKGFQLHVTLHAAPGKKRYIVKNPELSIDEGFIKRGAAIRAYNTYIGAA